MSQPGETWNGARWWKVDFHTHTPASNDYGKGPDQAALRSRSPQEWLLDYMRANIDCVVVTDHNSGAWIGPLKSALDELDQTKPDGYRPLWLFPGVEISVHGGIHLLAVLSRDKTTADVDTLLGAVGFSGTKGTSDGVTSKSFEVVAAEILKAGGLAIPAHVSSPKGLFTESTGTTLVQALDVDGIIAMEVAEPNWAKPGSYVAQGTHWTEVVGTDAHHPSGEPGTNFPGSRFTWVKMGAPSIEGLRLALRDGSLSVRRSDAGDDDPNSHAALMLESISVSDARYIGRPSALSLTLNPWLNAVVGGRGTGKSSLVEFLRLALGRSDELPEALATEFEKYSANHVARDDNGLLTPEAKIEVTYLRDGARFRVTHQSGVTPTTFIEEETNGGWRASQGDVSQRFPVRIFSQKQVFQLAKEPSALLHVVDDAPAVHRPEWGVSQDTLASRYLSLRAQIRELSSSIAEEGNLNGNLEDVKRKLTVFEHSQHAKVLSAYQARSRQQQAVNVWTQTWSGAGEKLRAAASEVAPPPFPPTDFGAGVEEGQLGSEATKVRDQLASVHDAVLELATRTDELAAKWQSTLDGSQWRRQVDSARAAHASLLEQLKSAGTDAPGAYAELVKQRQSIEAQLAEIGRRRTQMKQLEGQAATTLTEYGDHRKELTESRRQFLDGVLSGNEYVHITVEPFGSKDAAETELRHLLQRDQGGFEKDIGAPCGDGLLGRLFPSGSASPTAPVDTRLADIKQHLRRIATGIHRPEDLADQRFAGHVQRLPPETLDRLDLWFPEDSLAVSYSPTGDGGKFRPIAEGSPGQKTAALLAFLLSYGDEPLVLDQPEDDLDNRLIYDLIVKQLRTVKRRRQVVVVTHNSNIVVNGDAELVFALASRGGQTQKECEGCLQNGRVREEICKIMEGGREAFEERYRRIALESKRDRDPAG